jgi:predicted transposase/invertase (TIGR01784 family)
MRYLPQNLWYNYELRDISKFDCSKLMQKLGKLESKKREDYLRKLFYLMRLRPNIAKKLREKEKEDKMPFILDREIDPLYQEGVEKGLERGIEKGLQRGIQEGIEKGKAEGIRKRNIEIAKSLLDVLDDETIAKKTTLSVKEVKKLRISR